METKKRKSRKIRHIQSVKKDKRYSCGVNLNIKTMEKIYEEINDI